MSQSESRRTAAGPPTRSHRWTLHIAVLVVALGAVSFGVWDRLADGEEIPTHGSSPTAVQSAARDSAPPPAIAAIAIDQPSPLPIPAVAPTPASTPQPTPQPTPEPAAEPDPTPSPEPEPTPVPTARPAAAPPPPSPRSIAPARTPLPAVVARAVETASLRAAPNVDASISAYLPAGSSVSVLGCEAGCAWLLVALPGGGSGWTARHFWALTGDLSRVGGR